MWLFIVLLLPFIYVLCVDYFLPACFPGGMVDEDVDGTIIQTSLREMEEELGIPPEKVEVLGILRCDWTEVIGY